MKEFLCRILTVVFLFNALAAQAAVTPSRKNAPRSDHPLNGLEEKIAKQAAQQAPATQEELQLLSQEPDLSPAEKLLIELELETLKIEKMQREDNLPWAKQAYVARLKDLEEQKQAVEKYALLRDFYQEAQSAQLIAAAVYAMHQVANAGYAKAQASRANFNKLFAAHAFKTDFLTQTGPTAPKTQDLLKLWKENKISEADLIELVDPVVLDGVFQQNQRQISSAAELLLILFLTYNSQAQQLDRDTLDNTRWLALHLKYRISHQLYVLEKQTKTAQNALRFTEARGNLLLLLIQVKQFLAKNPAPQVSAQKDTQLPEYAIVAPLLNSAKPEEWVFSNLSQNLVAQIKRAFEQTPELQSADAEILANNVAYAVRYLAYTGHVEMLYDIVALINKDGNTYHDTYEKYVSSFFGSLYDFMLNYAPNYKTQQNVRRLLLCTAAPECTYGNVKQKNAVNVRAQAIALGSLLRQITHSGKVQQDDFSTSEIKNTSLNKDLFNDETFRTKLARYTVDIYWPMQRGNVNVQQNNIIRYGMGLDEVQKFSNILAGTFETFLPVKEPKTTIKNITAGDFAGCYTREIDPQNLVYLNVNDWNSNRFGFVQPKTSSKGRDCHKLPSNQLYGGLSTIVVTDSKGSLRGMMPLHPYNRDRAVRDLTDSFAHEMATWYLWGAAFKGLRLAKVALKATGIAGKSALKAKQGLKLARFNNKFAQAWKYGTEGWRKEIGLVNITQNGDKILVEMHRPGYKGYVFQIEKEALKGSSLKSIKGRLYLRLALQRKIYATYGSTAQKAASSSGKGARALLTGKTTQSAAASSASAQEKAAEKGIEKSNELAKEIATPLTRTQQRIVFQTEKPIVDAVKQEMYNGQAFEEIAGDKVPATVFRPRKAPEVFVNLKTGLPEKALLDKITGNVTGELSGHYAGTVITPFNQATAAYNIAAGLTHFPSPTFASNLLASQFPIIQEMSGLGKFVLGMTLLDMPTYYLYTKPYLNKLDKQQEKQLIKESGLNFSAGKQETQNALESIQSLSSNTDTFVGGTITGAYLGINQLFNTVLPQRVQMFRQMKGMPWLRNAIETIDAPIAKILPEMGDSKVSDFLPLPGEVMMIKLLPISLVVGDPTPSISESARIQAQQGAHNQALIEAVNKHPVNALKQRVDKILPLVDNFLNDFITANKILLDTLPSADKKLKKAFQSYRKGLERAKQLADTDLEEAQNIFRETDTQLVLKRSDILIQAIKAYWKQVTPITIVERISSLRQNFGTLVTAQDEAFVTELYENYARQKQAIGIALTNLEKQLNPDVQKQQDLLRKSELVENKTQQAWDQLFARLRLDQELDTFDTQQDEFMQRDDIMVSIPAAQEEMHRLFSVHKQHLKRARALLETAPTQAQELMKTVGEKFVNDQADLMLKYVEPFWEKQEKIYEEFYNAPFLNEQERKEVIHNYCKQQLELATEYWNLQKEAVSVQDPIELRMKLINNSFASWASREKFNKEMDLLDKADTFPENLQNFYPW